MSTTSIWTRCRHCPCSCRGRRVAHFPLPTRVLQALPGVIWLSVRITLACVPQGDSVWDHPGDIQIRRLLDEERVRLLQPFAEPPRPRSPATLAHSAEAVMRSVSHRLRRAHAWFAGQAKGESDKKKAMKKGNKKKKGTPMQLKCRARAGACRAIARVARRDFVGSFTRLLFTWCACLSPPAEAELEAGSEASLSLGAAASMTKKVHPPPP